MLVRVRPPRFLRVTVATLALTAFATGSAFAQSVSFPVPTGAPWAGEKNLVADIDGDGKPDVVHRIGYGPGWNFIHRGNGDGTFTLIANNPFRINFDIAVGDLNGDGRPDVAVIGAEPWGALQIMLNDGSGGFVAENSQTRDRLFFSTGLPAGQTETPNLVAVGDVNGDTYPDLVVASYRQPQRLHVLLNDGHANFRMGWESDFYGGSEANRLLLVDLDGDGVRDIVLTGYNRGANVWKGAGDGSFLPAFSLNADPSFPYWAGSTQYETVVADINHDGRPDVVIAEEYCDYSATINNCARWGGRIAWFENTGSLSSFVRHSAVEGRSFDTSSVQLDPGIAPMDGWGREVYYFMGLAAADLDGDGVADLVIAPVNGAPIAFANDGHGGFTRAWDSPATRSDTYPVVMSTLYLGDVTGNGRPTLFGGGYYGGVSWGEVIGRRVPSCQPGTYLASPADIACTPAPAGTYVALAGATSATSCPSGYFQPATGAVACIAAPTGTFVATTGSISANACPFGFTNTGIANTSCNVAAPAPVITGVPGPITVEATGAAGAAVSYIAPTATNYQGGSVPVVCTPASGATFPLGQATVQCTATDAASHASSASFTVRVVDTTKPVATATLTPVRRGGDDESAQYFRIAFSATDSVGVTSQSATLNGIAVTNGQIVQLKLITKGSQRTTRDDGILGIQALSFQLTVTAKDAAGNTTTATATPIFNKNGKDDENKKGGKSDR